MNVPATETVSTTPELALTPQLAEESVQSSPLASKEFSITMEDNTEDVSEMNDIMKDVAELDNLNEMIFSNVDVPLSWKEEFCEEDSEAELDNFVSQFTI